jgi:hypothetical protein
MMCASAGDPCDAANNTKDVKHPVILLVKEVVRYLEVVCYRA